MVRRFFCLRSPVAFDCAAGDDDDPANAATAVADGVVVSSVPWCLLTSSASSNFVECVGGGGGGTAGGGTGSGRFIAFDDSDLVELNFDFCFASHFSRLANFCRL